MPISILQSIIELSMALIMIISIIMMFVRSFKNQQAKTIKTDNKTNTVTETTGKVGGFGARIIQFACVTLIIPSIIILGIEKILSGETIATIIGGLIGYVLSGISNYDKDN